MGPHSDFGDDWEPTEAKADYILPSSSNINHTIDGDSYPLDWPDTYCIYSQNYISIYSLLLSCNLC